MTSAKPTIVLYLLVFLGIFVWAAVTDPTFAGFMTAVREPWGLVVTLDFVFGCLLLSWIIWLGARGAALGRGTVHRRQYRGRDLSVDAARPDPAAFGCYSLTHGSGQKGAGC